MSVLYQYEIFTARSKALVTLDVIDHFKFKPRIELILRFIDQFFIQFTLLLQSFVCKTTHTFFYIYSIGQINPGGQSWNIRQTKLEK